MVDLLKNSLKRKINNTKNEDLYIDCRFIFGSAARVERLFSHCKYIKTETRNRLTSQIFEAITFLKSNKKTLGKCTTINLMCNIVRIQIY